VSGPKAGCLSDIGGEERMGLPTHGERC